MKRVCVLGSTGFVGRNLLKGTDWVGISRQQLDLTNQSEVERYFNEHQYDVVIHCAVVGGSRLKSDDGNVTHTNIIMFENVARIFRGKLIYFSSGAALRGDPPTDPYGLSKWLIDRRIETIHDAYSLRIWGCYGDGELPTRFSAVCKREGHVIIDKDRYFDFIDIKDVKCVVMQYVNDATHVKSYDLVYEKKLLLSQWAEKFGASWEVRDSSSLGDSYIKLR